MTRPNPFGPDVHRPRRRKKMLERAGFKADKLTRGAITWDITTYDDGSTRVSSVVVFDSMADADDWIRRTTQDLIDRGLQK